MWYKDAVIYQVHMKCFSDSNADGIGDFRGLIDRLDYIVSLGVTAIWILPFYPSPLRDDGYDIADYYNINKDYGKLADFRTFLKEAHARKLKVITELVINHTSDQHEWFQKSREAKKGSKWDSYYMWSDTAEKYKDARIIFKDFENSNWTWDPVKKAYFWHRFYSHQPDLNFDSPHVKQEIFHVLDFWFEMGVDGLRLDAIPYLYAREGTNCENLPETHAFLKDLRAHVDSKYQDRMLLAEANQWPEDAVNYFGNDDECHMAFNFPLMPRMFMALQMEDRFPIVDIIEQTPKIPKDCQWAMFLRNHDELTLEMVTDEERDYMYRVYAKDPKARINLGIRRRLAPLLENNRSKIELMNILLLSLPGTPVIYYGDEIGMGDNYYLGDRNGVRTPMQWNAGRNGGFSEANPQQLYLPLIIDPQYHFENINVENQEQNQSSILWWTRNVITLRKKYKAFGNGTMQVLSSNNSKIIAFTRQYGREQILVVVNLSKYSQYAEIDLSDYSGYQPYDLFSHNKFPLIKEKDYGLSLGPHGYFWLWLEKETDIVKLTEDTTLPDIQISDVKNLFENSDFHKILKEYLPRCRWFQSKSKVIKNIALRQHRCISKWHLIILEVTLRDDSVELYFLPMTLVDKDFANLVMDEFPIAPIACVNKDTYCIDALYDEGFRAELLRMIQQKKTLHNNAGEVLFQKGRAFNKILDDKELSLNSKVIKEEQTNSSMIFDNQFYLKLYRKLDEGINPDLEVTKHLTENQKFPNVPQFAGSISLKDASQNVYTLGQLQSCIKNEGTAWNYFLEAAKLFFEELRTTKLPIIPFHFLNAPSHETISALDEVLSNYGADAASRIGQCTANMHLALARPKNSPSFNPEPFTHHDQRAAYETMRKQMKKVLELLPDNYQYVRSQESEMLEVIKVFTSQRFEILKLRIHGDYHLGQLLNVGKDFKIFDFEGEPMRTLGERRHKRLAFQDVAGMVRSFHYAAYWALYQHTTLRDEEYSQLEPWAEVWAEYMSHVFYHSYLSQISSTNLPLIPTSREDCQALLRAFILDKTIYEIRYELNNRPEWLVIPLRSLQNFSLKH